MGHQEIFGTDSSNIDNFNTVYVTSVNAFPPPDENNFITLPTKIKYILTKPLNTGILKFTTVPGGQIIITSENFLAHPWTTELSNGDALFSGDFGNLEKEKVDFFNTTGTGKLYSMTATTDIRPITSYKLGFVSNFGSIGEIDGMSQLQVEVGYVNCKEGLILNNPSSELRGGVVWRTVVFTNQSGTHLTVTGGSELLFFDQIGAQPAEGDAVFDFSNADNTAAGFGFLGIDTTLGGKTGLEQTINSDTALGSIFPVINVDTSLNTVKATLPDIDGVGIQNGTKRTLVDLGNAGTNNIEVVPFSVATTKVMELERFVMDVDNQSVIFEVAGDQWVIDANTDNYLVQFSTGFTGGTTETVLNDTSTFVKIAGVYVDGDFTRASATDGVVTSEGFLSTTVDIHANAELLLTPATETDIIEVALFRNNVEVTDSRTQKALDAVFQTPSSPSFNVKANIPWEEVDTLDLRMRNITNATNITATDAKIIGDRG